MSVTRKDLDSFHTYAVAKVSNGGTDLTWSDLFDLWRMENPTDAERTEVHEIIRQGLEDIDAGLGRPAREVMAELAKKHGLSDE